MSYVLDIKLNICFQHLIQLFNSVIGFFVLILSVGRDMMQKNLSYNTDNIFEIVKSLREVLNDLRRVDIFLRNAGGYLTSVLSSKRLIRIEISAQEYKLFYQDFTETYCARTARKMLGDLIKSSDYGFIRANEKDIINMNYAQSINEEGVRLLHVDFVVRLSRPGRARLEKFFEK